MSKNSFLIRVFAVLSVFAFSGFLSNSFGQSFISENSAVVPINEQPTTAIEEALIKPEDTVQDYPSEETPNYIVKAPVDKLDIDALNHIESLIAEGEYNQALSILADTVAVGSASENLKDFQLKEFQQFLLIKSHYHLGNIENVEELASQYMTQFVNGQHFYWVYYYFSSALFNQGKQLRQVYLVTEDFFTELPGRERNNLRKYLIENSLRSENYLSAIYFLEDEHGNLVPGYEKWIDDIIRNINELEDIEQVLERYENKEIRNLLQKRKVQLLVRDGMIERAEDYYYEMVVNEYETTEYEFLSAIYEIIRLAKETKPYRIGVILPTTHKSFKRLAFQVLDGLEMVLDKITVDGRPMELVIKDSAQKDSQPEFKKLSRNMKDLEKQKLVKNQVKDLIENHGVIAILGPLAKNTSIAAGEAASQLRVPIISYSITENIGEDNPYLFRFQQSQLGEAKRLASYAIDYLGAKRFVVFQNQGAKSFEVMQTFVKEVESRNGKIVGISNISRNQKDFSNNFKSFTGGFKYLSEEEIEELKKTREEPEPIIDFDAIFLPTDIRTLKVAMDFARFYNAGDVWFLAGSKANVRENQLLNKTNMLRFVGTFPVSGVKTYLQPFFETHWKYYNYRSNYSYPTDYTIYGYESLEIIGQLLQDPLNHNRESLKNAINNLNSVEVLTGSVTTEKNGELDKELKILKIVGTETVEVF